MNNIPERIIKLRLGSLCRILSDEEAAELQQWSDSHSNLKKDLDDLSGLFGDYMLAENYNSIDIGNAWKKVKNETLVKARPVRKTFRISMIRAVASILIIVMVVSTILLINRTGAPDSLLVNPKPGTSKAILELSGGGIVYLTSRTEIRDNNTFAPIIIPVESDVFICDSIPEEESIRKISVPYGGEYKVQLYDKTIVTLNSGSTLKLQDRFEDDIRRVELEGEAFFEVAKAEHKPFEVITRQSVVKVLGTKFNVCSYPEDGKELITLVEGRIEVLNRQKTYNMLPGELFISGFQVDDTGVIPVDTTLFVSWKDGIFRFHNLTLGDIVPKLERWYDVKFRFKDPDCKNNRFTGAVERNIDFEAFIRIIESTSNVRFTLTNNEVVISRK